jgi:hypothetical protein
MPQLLGRATIGESDGVHAKRKVHFHNHSDDSAMTERLIHPFDPCKNFLFGYNPPHVTDQKSTREGPAHTEGTGVPAQCISYGGRLLGAGDSESIAEKAYGIGNRTENKCESIAE